MAVQEAEAALSYHGGDLAAARAAFPSAPEPWLDLSTGINPRAYPVDLPASVFARLPEPGDLAALERAAAAFFGCAAADVVAAPGTQAILQALPALTGAARVGVAGFTYAEHARVFAAAGARVEAVDAPADLSGFDVGVVVSPNNPDGTRHAPADLARLARAMRGRGGRLVVDEAFADERAPAATLAPGAAEAGALVLRSFGKFFGLAGVRLGFLVGEAAVCGALKARLGPWAVPGPALALGRAAYADAPWIEATRARLAADARALDAVLVASGFEVVGGTGLFRLASRADAAVVFRRLGSRGVLTRPFRDRPTWLRFGVPEGPGLARLEAALRA